MVMFSAFMSILSLLRSAWAATRSPIARFLRRSTRSLAKALVLMVLAPTLEVVLTSPGGEAAAVLAALMAATLLALATILSALPRIEREDSPVSGDTGVMRDSAVDGLDIGGVLP